MQTLKRSTLRGKSRSTLKGAMVTTALACTFAISFVAAIAWLDWREAESGQGMRPLSMFLQKLFSGDDARSSDTQVDVVLETVDIPEDTGRQPDSREPPGEAFTVDVPAPIDIIDARTFVAGDIIYRLTGIRTPSRDAICFDEEDRLWACGLQARAAFNNLTRETGLACEGIRFGELEIALVDCHAGENDLATALVAAGFAIPADSETPSAPGAGGVDQAMNEERAIARHDMSSALRLAQTEKQGLWNGNWRIRD